MPNSIEPWRRLGSAEIFSGLAQGTFYLRTCKKSVPSTSSGNEFFSYLQKTTKPWMAAWQRGDFLWAGSGNEFFRTCKKVSLRRAQGTSFFRTCQTVQSHGGRLCGAEIFKENLRSRKKSTEGFFPGRLRERGWGDFFLLAKQYRAMEGGLAHAESRSDSAILRKIHGGIFYGQAQGTSFFRTCQKV